MLGENRLANLMYGFAASPLAFDNSILVAGGTVNSRESRTFHCFNRIDGKLQWKALDDTATYTSPMLVTLAGRRQLLIVTANRAVGLAPEDGRELWSFPWTVQYENAIAQPIIVSSNRFVISAAYGTGCAAVEVIPTGSGFKATRVWQNKNLKNKFASSVFLDGFIYGLDEDILTCISAETGQRQWKDGRYGYGQLLLAGQTVVILAGDGDLAFVKANPDRFEELARIHSLSGKSWNTPSIGDGKLLVRNAVEMACYDLQSEPKFSAK